MDYSTLDDVTEPSQAAPSPAPAQASQPEPASPTEEVAPTDERQAIDQEFAVDISTVPEEMRPVVEAEVEKFRKPMLQKLYKRSEQMAAERRAAQQSAQWRDLAMEMLKDPAARERYVAQYGPSLGVTPSTPAEDDVGDLSPAEYKRLLAQQAERIADERVRQALHADKLKTNNEMRWSGAWKDMESHPKYGHQFKILAPLVQAQMLQPDAPYQQAYTGDNEQEVIERAFLDVRKAYDDLSSAEKARRAHTPTTLSSSPALAKTGDAHWDTKAEILAEVRRELGS